MRFTRVAVAARARAPVTCPRPFRAACDAVHAVRVRAGSRAGNTWAGWSGVPVGGREGGGGLRVSRGRVHVAGSAGGQRGGKEAGTGGGGGEGGTQPGSRVARWGTPVPVRPSALSFEDNYGLCHWRNGVADGCECDSVTQG